MINNYLSNVKQQFEYYKSVGDKTFTQLEDQHFFIQHNPESNSIAIIVNHMWGNMMSRWTDFLTTDGEKDFRKRDEEFDDVIRTKNELIKKWEEGWKCLFSALNSIDQNNFDNTVYIRNQAHTITEAINRQMMHYAYHVGQIVTLAKIHKNGSFISLTIAKGKSKAFNDEKFSRGKHNGHFSDDLESL